MHNAPGLEAYYYGSTNLLRLTKARSQQAGGGIVNNATGTATLLDKNGVELATADLVYVPASQGQYEALFPAETPVVLNQFVSILIELVASAALKYRGVIEARVIQSA